MIKATTFPVEINAAYDAVVSADPTMAEPMAVMLAEKLAPCFGPPSIRGEAPADSVRVRSCAAACRDVSLADRMAA